MNGVIASTSATEMLKKLLPSFLVYVTILFTLFKASCINCRSKHKDGVL